MTIKIRTPLGLREISSIMVRGASSMKRVARIKLRTGLGVNDLNQIFTGVDQLSVEFNPRFADYRSFENETVSGVLSAVLSGGLSPFTYAWSVTAFSAATPPTISPASSATVSLAQSDVSPNATESATLQVIVSDSVGQTSTATVSASFTNISFN